jgi:hypothetical protein
VKVARPTVAVALVALLGLGACSSTPSAKAVAEDYVESIDGLTDEQRQCMLEKLDGYSSDELEAIGEANVNVDFDQPDAVETATAEFQEFVENLNTCMAGAGDGSGSG